MSIVTKFVRSFRFEHVDKFGNKFKTCYHRNGLRFFLKKTRGKRSHSTELRYQTADFIKFFGPKFQVENVYVFYYFYLEANL
jgi:hypothetical protein